MDLKEIVSFGASAGAAIFVVLNLTGVLKSRRSKAKLGPKSDQGTEKYILHVYDHCPFCIRVELALGWMGIKYERVVYGYGDIDGPKDRFGKKVLPVLEFDHGKGKSNHFMFESSDIIEHFETLRGESCKLLPPATNRFNEFLKTELKPLQRILCRTRIIKLPIKDWASQRDIDYALQKYTKAGFDYEKAKAGDSTAIHAMNVVLKKLNAKVFSEWSANEYGRSMDDILLLPELRTLSCVNGLEWPTKLRKYLENAFIDSEADSYFACQVDA